MKEEEEDEVEEGDIIKIYVVMRGCSIRRVG
jgi:hypothetical protein